MPASAGFIDRAAVRRSAESLLEGEGDPDDFAGPASARVCNVRTVMCACAPQHKQAQSATPSLAEKSLIFFPPGARNVRV